MDAPEKPATFARVFFHVAWFSLPLAYLALGAIASYTQRYPPREGDVVFSWAACTLSAVYVVLMLYTFIRSFSQHPRTKRALRLAAIFYIIVSMVYFSAGAAL